MSLSMDNLPWQFILAITLICLVVLIKIGVFIFCYCQRKRRNTSGAVLSGPTVINSPWPTSYPQQVPYQHSQNEVGGVGWNSGVVNQGFSSPPAYSDAVHCGQAATNSPWPTSYPQQVPYQLPPNEGGGGGWNSGVINLGFSSPSASSETKH